MATIKQSFLSKLLGRNTYNYFKKISKIIVLAYTIILIVLFWMSSFCYWSFFCRSRWRIIRELNHFNRSKLFQIYNNFQHTSNSSIRWYWKYNWKYHSGIYSNYSRSNVSCFGHANEFRIY